MKKATRISIEKAIQPYLYIGRDGYILKHEDVEKVMGMIMTDYSGVFCGVSENKAGNMVFAVTSTGVKRTRFFESMVR